MKILIAEDDFCSQELLQAILEEFGTVHISSNGRDTVDEFLAHLENADPYDLICLDIMMPIMDGQQALLEIRQIEQEKGITGEKAVKIIMTTALSDSKNIMKALIGGGCDAYVNKPISLDEIRNILPKLGFSLTQ